MRSILGLALVVLVGLGTAAFVAPTSESTKTTTQVRFLEAESELRELATAADVNGFSLVIVNSHETLHRADVGFADVENEIAVTPETLFNIASVHKSMNALLIATLVDEGVLGWDTAIAELVPEAGIDPEITMRHLLTMTGGIALDAERRLPITAISAEEVGPSVFEVTAREQNRPAPAGAKFSYSNVSAAAAGYAAVGTVASDGENVYDAYLRLFEERVLMPLGMDDSRLLTSDAEATGNLATGYVRGIRVASRDRDVDLLAPAGSLKSTGNDMARYVQMLLNHGVTADGDVLVSTDALRAMWEPVIDDYAMGWFSLIDEDDRPLLFHDGSWNGFGSLLIVYPESDLGVVILTNSETASADLLFRIEAFVDLLFESRAAD